VDLVLRASRRTGSARTTACCGALGGYTGGVERNPALLALERS
jgi:hypothetical protein